MTRRYRAKDKRRRWKAAIYFDNWTGVTMTHLFDKIQTSMLPDKPDSAVIWVYILKSHKFLAGDPELIEHPEDLGRTSAPQNFPE